MREKKLVNPLDDKDVSYSDTMGIKLRVEKEKQEEDKELMPKEQRELVVQHDIAKAEQLVAKKSLKNYVPKMSSKVKTIFAATFATLIVVAIILLVIYL